MISSGVAGREDPPRADRIGRRPAGHRAPAGLRIGTVSLQVADLERSLAFYRGVIGLQPIEGSEGGEDRVARLGAPGEDHPLLELHEKPGAKPARARGRLGLYHFALLLPDRAALGRFLLHAAANGAKIGQADHLYSEALYLTDPDGLQVEVYRDRPREEWTLNADAEIVGTVDALDVRGLAAAAGGVAWDGVPAGTTVGHMHLHVGDLDRASAFYHHGLGLDAVLWSLPGALFLSAGGYHHHVGLNTWAAGAAPSGEDDARLTNWEFIVPAEADVAATAASLEAAGFATTHVAGGVRATDPWGITVTVRRDRRTQ